MASPRKSCVLATVASDAHTWNLMYLQLLLEELGYEVRNLGCCTPPELVGAEVAAYRPDVVVISSVNGHGASEAQGLLQGLRMTCADGLPPVLIGGRLTASLADEPQARRALERAGYERVFTGGDAVPRFKGYLAEIERSEAVAA